MSSTWRYVREARGHLTEVYEQLLDMPPPPRLLVGMHPDQVMVEARSVAAQEWDNTRFAAVMSVVETLNKYDVGKLIAAWREHAIEFLRKTPSVRARQKFRDDEDRILFLCVVLWYARAAVRWLEAREGEGQLRGGSSFRDMTATAAHFGSLGAKIDETKTDILPHEWDIVCDLDDDDVRLDLYDKWSCFDAS